MPYLEIFGSVLQRVISRYKIFGYNARTSRKPEKKNNALQ